MTLVHCLGIGALVGLDAWLPSEPFDYAWGPFGCNQLRCGACKQPVRSSINAASSCRHYACACRSRDQHSFQPLGDDGQTHEVAAAWQCAGHPHLQLPVVLDGIEISDVAPFAAIVRQVLAAPPFVAPGFDTQSFWAQRLFWLLPAAQQARIGHAVAAQLAGDDARAASAAIDFFCATPAAPGGGDLAIVARRDRDRLRATLDPASETQETLYDRIIDAVDERLIVPHRGAPVDPAALDLSRHLIENNEAASTTIFNVASHDPAWFSARAAGIVRARPDTIGAVLEALVRLPSADRARALDDLRNVSAAARTALERWLDNNPSVRP